MPFSSATTGSVFSENTPQNANPIGYHLGDRSPNIQVVSNKLVQRNTLFLKVAQNTLKNQVKKYVK